MNDELSALDFKSATLYALRVVLRSADTEQLSQTLARRMKDAGSLFAGEPVVIDATALTDLVDWPALLTLLRGHDLPPIGVIAEGENLALARVAGLAPVELSHTPSRQAQAQAPAANATASAHAASSTHAGSAAETEKPTAPANATGATRSASDTAAESSPATSAAPPVAPGAMVVSRPLRSGQRIYARHTDLIVIGVVSRGAEIIADGNIHVYGPLRGKAMAGARGDTTARIYTTQLDAELLAVAGVYRVIESNLDAAVHHQPAMVYLDGEALKIEALKN